MSPRPVTLIALLTMLPLGASQAAPQLDFTGIVRDVEIMQKVDNQLTVTMWMPEQYWRASFQSNNTLTDNAKEEFLEALRPYTLVAVVDAKVGVAGAFTFSSAETLNAKVRVEDSAGNTYAPIDAQDLSASVKNLQQIMKPILTNVMGPLGSNFELMVFPASGKNGERIADATKEGSFTVRVGEQRFRYRLPLASLLPPVVDSRTGDSFPGNYHFNPYTGARLSPAPAPAEHK